MGKYRDTEKMTAGAEKLVEILGNSTELLEKLLPLLNSMPTEGFTRQQLWRLEQAKSSVQQRLLLLRNKCAAGDCQCNTNTLKR